MSRSRRRGVIRLPIGPFCSRILRGWAAAGLASSHLPDNIHAKCATAAAAAAGSVTAEVDGEGPNGLLGGDGGDGGDGGGDVSSIDVLAFWSVNPYYFAGPEGTGRPGYNGDLPGLLGMIDR
eukprot:SAG22_NODE_1844_length_3454_cov_2.054844_6_plen_122_part_00